MKDEKRDLEKMRAAMALRASSDPENWVSPPDIQQKVVFQSNRSSPAKPPLLGPALFTSVRSRNANALPAPSADIPINLENPGLTRTQLEEWRWKVSAPVAESTFQQLGIVLEGRAAQRVYAWPLILKLEGVPEKLAHSASPDTHPHLFEDLIDAKNASLLLGMSQPHLRKKVEAGQLQKCDIIRLGMRGMYRFRLAQIEDMARHKIEARLVGGPSRCA